MTDPKRSDASLRAEAPGGGRGIPRRTRLPDLRPGHTRTFRIPHPDDQQTELAEAHREIARLRGVLAHHQIDPGDPPGPPLPPVMGTFQFYVHANSRPDGNLGEIFIKGDKLGGFQGGALDALAMVISIGLQYGVPLGTFVGKLRGLSIGPGGRTGDKEFPQCSSMFDLLAQYLGKLYAHQIELEESSSASGVLGAESSSASGVLGAEKSSDLGTDAFARETDTESDKREIDRVARILIAAWATAEPGHGVTLHPVSYIATFCDLARAVIAYYRTKEAT